MINLEKTIVKNGEIDQQLLRYNAVILSTKNTQNRVFLPLAEDIVSFVNTGIYTQPKGLEKQTLNELLPHTNLRS